MPRVLLKLPTEAEQLQIVETIVKNNFSVRQTEEYVKKYLDTDEGEVTPKKKRLVIVNDVRIYLNSIKQIVSTIKDVGIPVSMEQDVDGGDVLVTLRIRNTKKPKEPRLFLSLLKQWSVKITAFLYVFLRIVLYKSS